LFSVQLQAVQGLRAPVLKNITFLRFRARL